MTTKGSIFSPILATFAVISSEKLVAYPVALKHPNLHLLLLLLRLVMPLLAFHIPLDPGPWILDSRASDHLSGNKDIFSSLTFNSPLPMVTLANGSQTVAKGIGLSCPLPSLSLTSVLYVHDSPFNLISISKLTRDLNCLIPFSNNSITLQDQSTGRTIGIGRES